jgi:hypothetical protein
MDGWMDPLVGNGIGEGLKVAFREKKKNCPFPITREQAK